ncbi:YbaB/EbfC family nucleoid-associated protein [Sphingobacterium faecale]|uniref:Nucleoid-associated protein JKG61_14740 n=1 Tax=Sphingobacterium faecale TaxID=2803775 RepID=A0ABS1R666_9SPHI|nr:YbaB/EbfC family nucleoid-associated protein [Sphingobacterium faecale]MBL1410010.1 YbaB/EbfC family nucleoid-associated protein [Sphingobacterium faecale]
MFDKLFQAQQKAQEIKSRLDNISVSAEAEGGKVRVVVTANKEIKEIVISDELFEDGDREQMEDLLLVALNKALTQAENVSQTEMQAATQDMFGGLGGLGNLFNK